MNTLSRQIVKTKKTILGAIYLVCLCTWILCKNNKPNVPVSWTLRYIYVEKRPLLYCSRSTYTKIGTIQRRLAWPLRKDDTQIREAFYIFCSYYYHHTRMCFFFSLTMRMCFFFHYEDVFFFYHSIS